MTALETPNLILRPFVREDLDERAPVDADPGTRGFAWRASVDREATARHLRRWTEGYRRGLGHLAMIHKADGELVGHCGLTQRDGGFLLAYALRKDYWCMGLAPEACRAVVRYGFEDLGLEEIRTEIPADNHPWRAMAERLGMTLRETARIETGEQVACYALSREEFMADRARATKGGVVR